MGQAQQRVVDLERDDAADAALLGVGQDALVPHGAEEAAVAVGR
jgi:hypothetical protein